MNKPNFILLILFILCNKVYSQASLYKPFCNNPSWIEVTSYAWTGTVATTYQYQKDTTINSRIYKKVKQSGTSFFHLFREEINQKKVYLYNQTLQNDSLIADFSLNMNSTFVSGSYTATVFKVDSILIQNKYHKQLSLSTPIGAHHWTEGILSIRGPLNSLIYPFCLSIGLHCMCHNGNYYYNPTSSCNLICKEVKNLTNVTKLNSSNRFDINVYPNPIKDEIKLSTDYYSTGKIDIEIFSNYGIILKHFETENVPSSIQNLNLNKGLYYIRISDFTGPIIEKKFLVE